MNLLVARQLFQQRQENIPEIYLSRYFPPVKTNRKSVDIITYLLSIHRPQLRHEMEVAVLLALAIYLQ